MDFKAYIKGKRKGKEAHNIERAAGHDPFLRDAIDGYDAVEGDHFASIDFLEKQVEALSKPRTRRFQPLFWYSSAATILLLLALWVFYPTTEKTDYLADENNTSINSDIEVSTNDSVENSVNTQKIEILTNDKPAKQIAQSKNRNIPYESDLAVAKPVVAEKKSDALPDEIDNGKLVIPENTVDAVAQRTDVFGMRTMSASKNAVGMAQIADDNKLRGRVIDENGEPIIGATITFKDTYKSVLTDINGNFVIDVPKNNNRPLVLSYIGYETKEVAVNEPTIEVKMHADQLALNEVVVVGYGSQKRTSRVGSVARVDNEVRKTPSEPIFGEKEFLRFYEVLRTKSICNTRKESLTARFYIDENGNATELQIEKASCDAMAEEFRRIVAQSPAWTKRDRIIVFKYE